jgi:para-nitrobenzyl esterase
MSGTLWTRRQVIVSGAVSAAGLLLQVTGWGAATKEPLAKTTAGPIRGRVEDGVFIFQGVSYGMDTAKTRFMAPKPPERWTTTRDCLTWGPRTIQPYTPPPPPRPARQAPAQPAEPRPSSERNYYMPPDLGPQSEDCLNLNV